MENKNHGILIASPKPTDYILGSNSPLSTDRIIQDWSPFLPANESQRNNIADFMICTTMSGPDHSLVTQLNYLIATGKLSDEAMNFFHNENYLVDGKFSLSARFNAKLNGTEPLKGQYLNVAADCVRRDGFIPEMDWRTTPDMSWAEFYSMISSGLIAKGKKALWFVDIKYQWVSKTDFPAALKFAPIQIATKTCPGWDSGQIVRKCPSDVLNHATMLYGQNEFLEWLDFDHYYPYRQVLAQDYEFPLCLQYLVTVKPITLRNSMWGSNVLQLQKDLNKLGFLTTADGRFGPKTEMQVKSFQNKTALIPDGIAGLKTLEKLKDMNTPRTILDVIIQVESGGDDYAHGDIGFKNPKTGIIEEAFGCLQIRQGVCDDVNRKFNTAYQARDCFGNRSMSVDIWNKYWLVYPNIQTDEDKARTWNGGPGWKIIYFKFNKTEKEIKYCQNLDAYWTKVEKLL